MKSIDKFVLVLVASLALLLAGCGGGSSTTEPVDPGPTPEEQQQAAIDQAVADALAAAEAERQAEADRMAAEERAAEMRAMTAKLWAAIGATPLASNAAGTVIADDGALTVQRTGPAAGVALEENEDATVASLHDWVGSEHTGKPADTVTDDSGTYTARLYSNVGEPTMGAKFNSGDGAGGVGFTLTDGVLTSGFDSNASRIASPQFDHSAGEKDFELPDPNPNGETLINIRGSYYGVAGMYTCTPGGNTCTATKAAGMGYTLGGGTWSFTPDNVEARVTEMPDRVYAVYGWWLHETADGATVSAFTGYRGEEVASAVDTLQGSATYRGGAAGKYAISAGAHNDSGHFTADAELKANFDTDMISGTISNFMGSDDMSRDWSVALKAGPVAANGTIASVASGTTWTMGGTDAAASGSWSGSLYNNNEGGVPSAGTGTFNSEFGNTGRMVGAFGVNLEE